MKVIGLGDNVVDKYEHIKVMYPGGNALNFAVFAKKLGVDAAFLGAFGNDAEGRHVETSAESLGVDLSHCRHYDGENGCARVELRNGDRTFLGSNRCGVLRTQGLRLLEEDYDYLSSFDLIHSGIFGFAEAEIKALKQQGSVISYDFSNYFTKEYLEKILPYVDYPVFSCSHLSMEEMENLISYSVEKGCRLVLCTRGEEGAWLSDGKKTYRQLPHLVEARDTMAAGDSFLTCFLVTYLKTIEDQKETAEETAEETAIRTALEAAAEFAAAQCLVDGSWGCGKSYD